MDAPYIPVAKARGFTTHWIRNKFLLLYFLCGYAHSCAFISVIELPRIPAYYPKIPKLALYFYV